MRDGDGVWPFFFTFASDLNKKQGYKFKLFLNFNDQFLVRSLLQLCHKRALKLVACCQLQI